MVAVLRPDSPVRPPYRIESRRTATRRVEPRLPAGPGTRSRRQAPEVYRRRRIVVLGAVVFSLVAAWLGLRGVVGGSAGALPPSRSIAAHSVVVRPGDTLWSIAVASGVRGDVRPLVDQLSAEVHGQPLQPGEVIQLP